MSKEHSLVRYTFCPFNSSGISGNLNINGISCAICGLLIKYGIMTSLNFELENYGISKNSSTKLQTYSNLLNLCSYSLYVLKYCLTLLSGCHLSIFTSNFHMNMKAVSMMLLGSRSKFFMALESIF